MARAAVKVLCAVAGLLMAAALGGGCLDPTQITVDVSSNVPCDQSKGTAFTGGRPGTVERAKPSTTTMDCSAGRIGTLVATPSGDKDSAAAFLIVQGVDRPAADCAANGFKGCIVQRRILRYISHTPLLLPVPMRLVCKDVACDEFSTCAKSGQCVSATIKNPEDCAKGACVPEGDELGDDPPDAGGDTRDGDATSDGASDDAKVDGAGDSGTDAPPPPPPGTLYCPPTAGCASGSTCCWRRQSPVPQGSCIPGGASCPGGPADLPMQCNRRSDCAAGSFCCASDVVPFPPPPPEQTFADTHCSPPGLPCKWICLDASDCPTSALPMICNRETAYFTPGGIMGVCESAPVVRDGGAER